MDSQADTIVGRETELSLLEGLLDASQSPRTIVLEGAPGLGKTTLWRAAVESAIRRGFAVISSTPVASEARLSYASLGDLLEDSLDDLLPSLPPPRRRALEFALLREDPVGPAPDQRAVSLATLSALRALAAPRPLVIAVDDVQWMDVPSARVLRFAFRRLRDEPIAVLAALRREPNLADPVDLQGISEPPAVTVLALKGLDESSTRRLIVERLGHDLPRPILRKLHKASEGNPFFSLELARALAKREGHLDPGEPLPVPERLQELLSARLEPISGSTRGILLAAAATSRPTVPLISAVSADGANIGAELRSAVDAGVIDALGGESIRFAHPLLAGAIYGDATPEERREIHRRFAKRVTDPEERARHLALAAQGPDAFAAAAAEEAAKHAKGRGALDAAAELCQLAASLTATDEREHRLRLILISATHRFEAGDADGARAALRDALAEPGPPLLRVTALIRLANTRWNNVGFLMRHYRLAQEEAGDNPHCRLEIAMNEAWALLYGGDLEAAESRATEAVEITNSLRGRPWTEPVQLEDPWPDPALLAFRTQFSYSILAIVRALRGKDAYGPLERAFAIDARAPVIGTGTPPMARGLIRMWSGDLEGAREDLEGELRRYTERGMESARVEILGPLSELECRAGNLALAADHAEEAYDIAVEAGLPDLLDELHFYRALVAALHGDADNARRMAKEGLAISDAAGNRLSSLHNRAVLGFVELSCRNAAEAVDHLRELPDELDAMGVHEPGALPCIPDLIEALLGMGDVDRADALTDRLEGQGRTLERALALSCAARCRGLILATRGDLDGSIVVLEAAVEEHERLAHPFELARTLLAKGEVERRAKRKRASRASLARALHSFEALGASLWAERAQAELDRAGGRAVGPLALSATEQQIAEFAAVGRTNREIADAMFVTVKTVEANLSRVFRKLSVNSRTELTRAMADRSPRS